VATRSGKANPVEAKRGSFSPRTVLFRNAGLASVWDWGDKVDELERTGTAVSLIADCRLSVSMSAFVESDVAAAVSALRVTTSDLSGVITRLADILCDERLAVTELFGLQRDCDQQTVVTSTAELRSDERIVATEVRTSFSDVNAAVTNLLSKGFDTLLLVSATDPELLAADTRVGVSGTVFANGDLQLVVSAAIERPADAGIVVFGTAGGLIDLRFIVGGGVGLNADTSAAIANTRFAEGDFRQAIASQTVLVIDAAIRVLSRMTPDADMAQTIYALLVRESHTIQV